MSTEKQTEQRFENMVTILIASVAIWVAITAYFQNYASNISDQARRRAQQYSIEATKRQVTGTIQFSYDWQGAFQTWQELEWQRVAAQENGDLAAKERFERLQESILPLSPMLGLEYFDSNRTIPDSYKYEADSYFVEATRLSETYLAESELGNFTDDTADGLTVQITLLTVTLSLYGLSMALKGQIRWLFIFVGSGIVLLCMVSLTWSLLELAFRPTVNAEAIQAYSEGMGLVYQARDEEAIEKFTIAIEKNPDYAKAYYERGLSYFYLGDFTTAISEIETARSKGLDDVSLNWNLGWIYYLTGQYDKSIEANNRVLWNNPDVLGVRMNQALSHLAKGDFANAQAEYDRTLQEALRQVDEARRNNAEPSASLWLYMDAGALDLQSLIDQLDNTPKEWTQAPTANLITGDHNAVHEFAFSQMKRLKEATVSLEYTGQLPSNPSPIQVEPFVFGQITGVDDDGFITGFEPAPNEIIPFGEEESFTVEFTYTGAAPKVMVWKVYVNGSENQSLRIYTEEDLSAGNTWYKTFGYGYTNVFILSEGEYTVEFYADNVLVQSGSFKVQAP